ncbi:carbohydrate ABC transporter permease [Chengkuizengella axinellae]|uniref:Sugar ABC transporter permease n=1 Tax=Chengkuizengella axinellae TaxID=3064388 RepID=A0ABT9J0P2_9BACL|nr:sugar ABC transporter permease [Chengkuizengella sp. 2205SS18-9]MDP5275148.1 sugar ABC transporter permease [Chengkuizengella sp. 2205SS18-9]
MSMGNKSENKKPRFKYGSQASKDALSGYLYVSPFFLLFTVFGLFPILFNMYVSLFSWRLFKGEPEFIGFQNYVWLLTDDPTFIKSIVNTFSMWFMATLPQLFLALVIAFVLNQAFVKFKDMFRMAIFMPFVTSLVAVTIIFGNLFSRDYGLINFILGTQGLDWLNDNRWLSHFAITLMVNWRWIGYNTIIYMAGLQTISKELYEAATIDGASKVQQFFYITIPQLRPIILFTLIMSVSGGMQLFVEPLVWAGAGGGADNQVLTMFLYMYNTAFGVQYNIGYGAAIGWVMFIIIILFAILNWIISTKLIKD